MDFADFFNGERVNDRNEMYLQVSELKTKNCAIFGLKFKFRSIRRIVAGVYGV